MQYVAVQQMVSEESLRKAKAFQESTMLDKMMLLDHPLIRKRIILKK
jgi:hypothetical protein